MPNSDKDLPSVYIGVPTGYLKKYAILYMLASIRNVDYPPERLKLAISVTDLKNRESLLFSKQLKELVYAADMPFETSILTTYPTDDDFQRWGPYFGVILNIHQLRVDFLQEQYDYFWLLGGDNPPERGTLKKLLASNVDLASASILQRPGHGAPDRDLHPLLWLNHWEMPDLPDDLEPILRDELRTAWLEFAFLKYPDKKLFKKKRVDGGLFGSGCSLIRRELFEHAGYALGKAGVHSEDLHFALWAKLLGYKTCLNLTARCGHFDENGTIY